MPRYLIQFAQFHDEFRVPELESLAKLEGVDIKYREDEYDDESPFLVVETEDEKAIRKLIRRSILIKYVFELWAVGTSYEDVHASLKKEMDVLTPPYMETSFKFTVKAFGGTLAPAHQLAMINSFAYLGFRGPIDLVSPKEEFVVIEDYKLDFSRHTLPPHPERVFFGRLVGQANRAVVDKFDVKKRAYIGNTTMDAELSLVMANQALARPGTLIYDPFVGTGSFLVTCAHFGACVMGSDIDGRQLRGKEGKSILSNVEQYKIHDRYMGTLATDLANHPWRNDRPLFDAIVTAPYGVRAGAKRLGRKDGKPRPMHLRDGVPAHTHEDYVPPTRGWEMSEVLESLLDFSAKYLVPGGRLVYWLPTVTDQYTDEDVPLHPALRLVSNSNQPFGAWCRRLITMERTPIPLDQVKEEGIEEKGGEEEGKKEESQKKRDVSQLGHGHFREKYFMGAAQRSVTKETRTLGEDK